MTQADAKSFGALAPGWFDRAVLALTTRLPDNWLGLRTAILLRRAVTMRLDDPDGALDVERWGMRLRLHPRDNGCEKNLLFTPQMYETTELNELGAAVAEAATAGRPFVFVDIGANVGLFSLFVAARGGRSARILAIEPEPGNVRRLAFNVGANPQVSIKVISIALSDTPGDVAIERQGRDRGGSRTRKVSRATAANDTVLVAAQPLLAVLSSERIDTIDGLKIDVEGAEDVILHPFFRDAPRRSWPRLMIIEDSRDCWKVDLMALLSSNGYAVAARSRQNFVLRLAPDHAQAAGLQQTCSSEPRYEGRMEAVLGSGSDHDDNASSEEA